MCLVAKKTIQENDIGNNHPSRETPVDLYPLTKILSP